MAKRTVPSRARISRSKDSSRRYSSVVVDGYAQAPSRAMLRAVGYKDADFSKPSIGIASTWSNLTPCNMHIDKLAKAAAGAVDKAGGKSTVFGTITVSDGISNGTPGMRYSLVSREVIADSIETVSGAQGFDGIVAIGGCDKNMPGCVMALARLDRPASSAATSFLYSKQSVREQPARSMMRICWTSNVLRFQVRAAAAACTRRTRWHLPLKRWE